MMKLYMIIICMSLVMICIVALIRVYRMEMQLRLFAMQLHEIRTEDRNQLLTVDLFEKEFLNLAHELNEYIQKEHQLRNVMKEDRQSVNQMVAGISHDFRTPLTAAMGYIQLVMEEEEFSPQGRERLKIALDKTKYLKELSDEFFALSLIENRRVGDVTRLSFRKILEEITLEQYELISQKGLVIEPTLMEDPGMIYGMEVDICRMIYNLFSNAIKYAKKKIELELSKENEWIIFKIQNDMDERITKRQDLLDTQKVFEPFFRTTTDMKGTGLGLYVVKRIVESYGGEIRASVTEGKFCIAIKMRGIIPKEN